jgi:hypothetical protein
MVINAGNFRPGDTIPQTGIYTVRHCSHEGNQRTQALLSSQTFPRCRMCGSDVRFQLLASIPHIFEDDDFSHATVRGFAPKADTSMVIRIRRYSA